MVDVVSFILSDEEDSNGTFTESIRYIETAEKQGITKLIVAPFMNQSTILETEAIMQKVERLNRKLQGRGSNVEVLPGARIALFEDLIEQEQIDELITLAGTTGYILLTLPDDELPDYLNDLCYQIKLQGITPVLESVEQKQYFHDQPNSLYRLVKNGSAAQINAASINGKNGSKVKKFTRQLIEANLVQLITTNSSNDHLVLTDAYKEIDKKYGTETVRYFRDNNAALAEGEEVTFYLPERIKKRSLLKIW